MTMINTIVSVTLVTLIQHACGQFPGLTLLTSDGACHGADDRNASYINLMCPVNHVIAIAHITLGAKPQALDCPLIYNSSFGYNMCCTNNETDCRYPFNKENYQYHKQCDGQPTCYNTTQHQLIGNNCNDSYGAKMVATSHYMFMDYYCIEADKIIEMCPLIAKELTNNADLYLWNRNFPNSSIQSSDNHCECSVEIDNCQGEIRITTMFKLLAQDNDTNCDQNVTVTDGNNRPFVVWSCDNNSQTIETTTFTSTYVIITLRNERNESDGKLWLGFHGSNSSNITVSCPPKAQQHCIPTTTAAMTTSSSQTTTTTTSTTTTLSSTTTSELTSTSTTDRTSSTSADVPSSTHIMSTSVLPDRNDDWRIAVIVLGTLVAVLVIAVAILSYCLLKRCRRQNIDAEKTSSDGQSLPLSSSAESLSAQKIVLGNTVISQGMLQNLTSEKECQVNWKPPSVITSNSGCQTDSIKPTLLTSDAECQVTLKTETCDSCTNTGPAALSRDASAQSEKSSTKNRKIQSDQSEYKPQLTSSQCQTDFPFSVDNSNKDQPETRQRDLCKEDENDITTFGSVCVTNSRRAISRQNKKAKRKKRETSEHDQIPLSTESYLYDVRLKPPVKLELIYPEIGSGPLGSDLSKHRDADKDALTGDGGRYENSLTNDIEPITIQVLPQEHESQRVPKKTKSPVDLRKVMLNSFFAQEKAGEEFEKAFRRSAKKLRKKTKCTRVNDKTI